MIGGWTGGGLNLRVPLEVTSEGAKEGTLSKIFTKIARS